MTESFFLQSCNLAPEKKMTWREIGTGQPLVLLHGWSMSSSVFSEVAIQLGKYFRVLCPDLPGHGGSEAIRPISLESFASWIINWLVHLQLPRVNLLGWSLGGQVALQMALQNPEQVNNLLLVATTPRFCQTLDWPHGLPKIQLRALERNLTRSYEKAMGDFFNLQFAGEELSKERFREILRFAVRPSHLPDPEIAGETLTLLGKADLRPRISSIILPTQVLHGEEDQIIPVAAGRYLGEVIPGAEVIVMPKVGHSPFFSQPEESVRLWLDFLQ